MNFDNVVRLKIDDNNNIKDTSPLVFFLYHLLQNHLPAGEVGDLVAEAELVENVSYSNEDLAKYAQKLAARLSK